MDFGVLGNSSVFIKKEVNEGTHVPPTSSADALEILEEGFQFNYTRETIENKVLSGTIEPNATRAGIPTIEGQMSVNYKAAAVAGDAPPAGLMFESLLGGKRQITAAVTTETGHTSTVIQINAADIAKFKKGDIVLVKEAGKFEVRPIGSIVGNTIVFPFALENGAPSDNVVIEKVTMYHPKAGAPTLSVTEYLGGKIEEKIAGVRCISGTIASWETGKTASVQFNMSGSSFQRSVNVPAFTPDFSGETLPPVMLNACVWLGGVKTPYNSLGISIENTKVDVMSACAPQGKIGSRFTELKVSAEIAPYMEMDDVDRFNSYNLNDDISFFGFAANPTGVDGEFKEIVAFWLPKTKITEMPTGNIDGVLTDQIKLAAHQGSGEDTVFLGFI